MFFRQAGRLLAAAVACWSVCLALLPPGRAEEASSPPEARPDLHLKNFRVGRILFLGNSITLHPPAPEIGWQGNWGMAASSAEQDYVHLLTAKIAAAVAGKPQVLVKNIADFERQHATYDLTAGLKKELAFEPDLVFVAIGENVPALLTDEAQAKFATAFAGLLAELDKHGHPAIVMRSSFWPDPTKDAIMKRACGAAGGTYVDISELSKDNSNSARSQGKFENPGVAGHPGDKGMQAIADALWAALQNAAAAPRP